MIKKFENFEPLKYNEDFDWTEDDFDVEEEEPQNFSNDILNIFIGTIQLMDGKILSVGTKGFRFKLENIYGDGFYTITYYDKSGWKISTKHKYLPVTTSMSDILKKISML